MRGGFNAATPEAADDLVRRFGEHFPVLDEGWSKTPAGYFDRTIMVRFPDGQVGEVQIWPPGMHDAKEHQGGHAIYKEYSALPRGAPEKSALKLKMSALYAGVNDKLPDAWDGLFGERR